MAAGTQAAPSIRISKEISAREVAVHECSERHIVAKESMRRSIFNSECLKVLDSAWISSSRSFEKSTFSRTAIYNVCNSEHTSDPVRA